MKHPVSGEVKELTEPQFLELFDPSVHDRLKAVAGRPDVEALVCCECLQLDSSFAGHRTAVALGPGCTYQVEEIEKGFRLGDVPSRFQYPVALWRFKSVED
jgi:hypothetical protein